jgi:hypothetical protein
MQRLAGSPPAHLGKPVLLLQVAQRALDAFTANLEDSLGSSQQQPQEQQEQQHEVRQAEQEAQPQDLSWRAGASAAQATAQLAADRHLRPFSAPATGAAATAAGRTPAARPASAVYSLPRSSGSGAAELEGGLAAAAAGAGASGGSAAKGRLSLGGHPPRPPGHRSSGVKPPKLRPQALAAAYADLAAAEAAAAAPAKRAGPRASSASSSNSKQAAAGGQMPAIAEEREGLAPGGEQGELEQEEPLLELHGGLLLLS